MEVAKNGKIEPLACGSFKNFLQISGSGKFRFVSIFSGIASCKRGPTGAGTAAKTDFAKVVSIGNLHIAEVLDYFRESGCMLSKAKKRYDS